jgi:hypothetical protein
VYKARERETQATRKNNYIGKDKIIEKYKKMGSSQVSPISVPSKSQ